jgi:serine protease Do
VIIEWVQEGSPAEQVGLRPQDIIMQVNKVKINSLADYMAEIKKTTAKDGVLFLMKRGTVSTFVPLRP